MNLPNAMTVGRIVATPAIALLPFADSWQLRLLAFVLFVAAAITDYYDGMLARTRNLVSDLGKQLDPLADKLLLVGTLVPMFWLTHSGLHAGLLSLHRDPLVPGVDGPMALPGAPPGHAAFPFLTPLGPIALPWWVLAVVIGREVFMTAFRSAAARRGTVISAIGPAKWKTGFQLVWVGAAYFGFWASTLAAREQWTSAAWRAFAQFNGIVGVLTMIGAVGLTLYSLVLYLQRYGDVLWGRPATPPRA